MKNLLKAFIFTGILVVLVIISELILISGIDIRKHGIFKSANYELLGEKKDTIDVIFLGDSLIYSSISPMEIWNNYGYTTFDCAEAAQIIPDAYSYLKFAIENQHPKIIMMEANVMFRNPSKRKMGERIAIFFKQFVPITKYHDNWKKYIDGSKKKWVNPNKGYKYITLTESSKNKNYMIYSNKYHEIPKQNLPYIKKIIDLCEENDVKLVLVSLPTQNSWHYRKHNTTEKVAKENNLEFIDLNLVDLNINWETDTKDNGAHLNYLGAKKVSDYIGNYLHSTKLITDHRNDSDYKSWYRAYKKYEKNSVSN